MRVIKQTLIFAVVSVLLPLPARGQGETTSAIVGQVTDATNAAVAGASVTVINRETGAMRRALTDETGRFNFPQLKPGSYSVKAEAEGFEPQKNDKVFAGLGQKQTVDFRLKVAQASETVEVSSATSADQPGKCQYVHQL